MASDNPKIMNFNKFYKWFNYQKKINKFKVKKVNLREIKNWNIKSDKISHATNKFFKIVGIKVRSNFYKKNWDQPIILQNEVGVLGIIKNPKSKKYLLQAKVEPGNINKLQLAPSVQATESNYKGAHGGKKVPYINFFLKLKNKKKHHQSEQGFRYLNKFNSNILINKSKIFKKGNNFFWFSKEEIRKLILKKNLINMDTLSVFSTTIKKKDIRESSINSKKKIFSWFKKKDKKYYVKIKKVKLASLKDWILNKYKIYHKKKKHFSVIGIDIKTSKRENNKWSQPILEGKKIAFAGFIKKNINNHEHYLCRYILKPGLKKSVVSCTVNTSDLLNFKKDKNLSNLDKNYIKKYFLKKNHKVEYDNILSEEGGRFYKCQIRYMIINVGFNELNKIADNYIWLSHNQIIDLIEKKRLDIESRLLFACGNIENIK